MSSEFKEVYINNPAYNSATYETEFFQVPSINNITLTINSSSNCSFGFKWTTDLNYFVIDTDTYNLIGGQTDTVHSIIKSKYVQIFVSGLTAPCSLTVQAFYSENPQGVDIIESTGTGIDIYDSYKIKSLVSTDNSIIIDNLTTSIDLRAGSIVYPITLTSTGATGSLSLVSHQTGPNLMLKGLTGGTGISITDGGSSLIFSGTSSTTLTSTGGESLVVDGTGPTLSIKGLTAGSGIILTNNANDIVINSADTNVSTIEMAMGEIYYKSYAGFNTGVVTLNTWFKLAPTTTLVTTSDLQGNPFFDNGGANNGSLRYLGVATKIVKADFNLSFKGTLGDLWSFIFIINGVQAINSETFVRATGEDQTVNVQKLLSAVQNYVIEAHAKNSTSTNGLIINTFNLQVITQGIMWRDLVSITGVYRRQSWSLNAGAFNTLNYTIIDVVHPNISFVTNQPNFTFNASGTYTFNYSSTQISVSTVTFYVNNIQVTQQTSASNLAFSITLSIIAGDIFKGDILKGTGNSSFANVTLQIIS